MGRGWSKRLAQQHKLVSREMMEKAKGKASLFWHQERRTWWALFPRGLLAAHPDHKKRNSHQSALSHSFPPQPQGRGGFLQGPLGSSDSSHGLCILLSHSRPSPGAKQKLAMVGLALLFPQQALNSGIRERPAAKVRAAQESGCSMEGRQRINQIGPLWLSYSSFSH